MRSKTLLFILTYPCHVLWALGYSNITNVSSTMTIPTEYFSGTSTDPHTGSDMLQNNTWASNQSELVLNLTSGMTEVSTSTPRTTVIPDQTRDIWLLGLFPFSGPWPGGLGQLPAIQMGLQDVNSDPNMLPGHRLRMTVDNTEVR